MQITYSLPHVFFPGASPVENARVLRVLLDMLIELNRVYLLSHTPPALYRSGVVYGRTKEWEPIPALYARRYGDCKSLSAALIAEYRHKGIACEPVFRWVRKPEREGHTDYHILVPTKDGFEGPSKVLGMGKDENSNYVPRLR